MNGNDLSATAITNNLNACFIGKKVIYSPRLTSTMDMARQEVKKGIVEGTVIIAEEQTEGRGRIRRKWLSPKGSIAISIILYPEVAYLPSLIMLASLAVVNSIKAVTGLKSGIKWPNDVLVKGKKAYFQVGGAVTYDSDPEAEYHETLDKARALIDAVNTEATRIR